MSIRCCTPCSRMLPCVIGGPGGCFGIIRLLIAESPLLSYQPIIVLRILVIGFGSD
jgi:hypothetical protein